MKIVWPKISKSQIALFAAIAILFTISGGFAAYEWQYDKLKASTDKVNNLQKKTSALNSEVSTLQKKYDDISKELSAKLQADSTKGALTSGISPANTITREPSQADLGIIVNSSNRFNASGTEGAASTGVAVEMTITNKTTSAIAFSFTSLQLQDSQYHTYQIYPYFSSLYLPSGYIPLSNQTINPGQTIRGSMTFLVNDVSQNNFTLINGVKSYVFKTS